MSDGFVVLSQFDVCVTDVFGDLEPHLFGGVGQDVEGHLVHLDCGRVFLLVVVDVPHVDPDPSCEGVLLSFYDFVVFCQSLLEHAAGLETEGMVEGRSEGQLHVDEIRSV